jgi:hypothetical protein
MNKFLLYNMLYLAVFYTQFGSTENQNDSIYTTSHSKLLFKKIPMPHPSQERAIYLGDAIETSGVRWIATTIGVFSYDGVSLSLREDISNAVADGYFGAITISKDDELFLGTSRVF